MAYDEGLATRVREAIGDQPGLAEKQMFGGLAFLVHGNMACGVRGGDLIVRLAADAGLSLPHLAVGFVRAHPAVTSVIVGARTEEQLADNLAAADLKLAAADIERLDKVSAQPLPYPFWHHLNAKDRLSSADLSLLSRHIND